MKNPVNTGLNPRVSALTKRSTMKKVIVSLLAAALVIVISTGDSMGRGGFGGFGGGRAGGMGGGWGGDVRAGGGSFDVSRAGAYRTEGYGYGGYTSRSYEGYATRGYGDAYSHEYRPQAVRSYSDEAWRAGGAYGADRFRDTAGVSRDRLDKFLGMPTDAGLGAVTSGAAVEGTRVTAGRVEGPYGGSAAFISGTHVNYVPSSVRSVQAVSVRQNFYGHDWFNPAWWRTHPGAWTAAGIAASAWAPATWYGVADWLGCDSIPQDYDYGSTVLYEGDNVYMEGQPVGTPAQYYDQATSLAATGASDQGAQDQWMPLGVFGLAQGDQTDPTMIFQLAVNRQGIIKGNCVNTPTQTTLPVQGAVDKKTQKVAWTVGDNKTTVYESGLYNLTEDESSALVHTGKDKTQECLMVRMKSSTQAKQG
jgi:hypothetical protein